MLTPFLNSLPDFKSVAWLEVEVLTHFPTKKYEGNFVKYPLTFTLKILFANSA